MSDIITSIAEQLAEEDSDPEAVELYVDRLSDLADDPVNLNSADETSLSRLFFLTDFQIKALASYSHSTGKILSVYEIANVTGFNRETTEMIIPFITLKTSPPSEKNQDSPDNNLLTNISYSSASTDSSYSGSPVRLLSKYRFRNGTFSGGFTMEKDPGEILLSESSHMPDFFSSYLEYSGKRFIRKIIIGDYSAKFGQGSCINTGWRSGLSLTVPGYMSSVNEIRQYTSSDENSFFRGVAASFTLENLSFTIFYSQNNIDATLNDQGEHVKNLYTGGLHNTPSMILKKDVLSDMTYGINLGYSFKNLKTGVIATEDRLSIPFEVSSQDPENIFDFSGKRNTLYSFYYNSLLNGILIYGELTFNSTLKHALVQGFSFRLSDRLTVNSLLRSYEEGYFAFHGKGFGGSFRNENSILGNFTFEAAKHLFVSAGSDFRSYPWLRYRCSSPSWSARQEIRVKYLPDNNMSVEAVYNHNLSTGDKKTDAGIPALAESTSDYIRASFRYSPVEKLTLTTRIDYKSAEPSGEKGMLIAQDVNFGTAKVPVKFWFRYCLFRTGGWNSRLYTYENDLLYSFSIPALYGSGSRSYVMVKYEIGHFAEIRLRYGLTMQDAENKEDLRFQLRLFF